MTVLIVGSDGQDGTFLKLHYYKLGKEYLACNRFGISKNDSLIISSSRLTPKLLCEIFKEFKISEIFFLAGENDPDEIRDKANIFKSQYLFTTQEILTMILESIECLKLRMKFLFANSALIFAGSSEFPQNESTIPKPLEKYASNKLVLASELESFQRKNDYFKLFNLIFYNHESVYRKPNFFTRKVIESAIMRSNSDLNADRITIHKPSALIDMSHAADFMINSVNIVNSNKPGTYVFSSGVGITARDFVMEVFDFLNLSVKNAVIFSETDNVLHSTPLIGDASKIKSELGQLFISSNERISVRLTKDWLKYLGR